MERTRATTHTVLVVDDEPVARRMLANVIRTLGHHVTEAPDGATALRMHARVPADVVISDWQMPGMSGLELCARIRRAAAGAYVYFLLLTGVDSRRRFSEGRAAGVDDYVSKPVDLDELEARLATGFRIVEMHRALHEQNLRLRRQSERLFIDARTDRLTGLGNRAALDEVVNIAIARAQRYGHAFSAILADVDHFKRYNDACGHLAGDTALRRIAQAMRATLRQEDALFRYGGEELLAILPEASADDACRSAARARRCVRELGLATTEGGVLTVSAGIAALHESDDATSWIGRADAALYAAKASGRDCVVVAPPDRTVSGVRARSAQAARRADGDGRPSP